MTIPANPGPGTTPPTPAQNPAPTGDQPPAPQPPAPAPQPFAVFPDSASFNSRVDREARARLKELGVEDPAKLKELLARNAELEAAAEKARQASLTELEREREQRATFERQAAEAAARAAEAERKSNYYDIFAAKGVRNFDYAYYEMIKAQSKEGDGFNPSAYIDTLLGDPTKRAAIMATNDPPPPPPARGATTTPGERETPPPPAGDAPNGPVDANAMTREEFQRSLAAKYGFHM